MVVSTPWQLLVSWDHQWVRKKKWWNHQPETREYHLPWILGKIIHISSTHYGDIHCGPARPSSCGEASVWSCDIYSWSMDISTVGPQLVYVLCANIYLYTFNTYRYSIWLYVRVMSLPVHIWSVQIMGIFWNRDTVTASKYTDFKIKNMAF